MKKFEHKDNIPTDLIFFDLLGAFSIVSLISAHILLKEKLQIQKSLSQKVTIEKLPESVLETDLKRFNKRFCKMEFSKRINIFIKTVRNEMPHANLSLLFKNAQTTQYIKRKSKLKEINVGGRYSSKTNLSHKLEILNSDFDDAIFHELFHMASTTYHKGCYFVGFKQQHISKTSTSIGQGLNEGYTQLLTLRYFINYTRKNPYPLEMNIANIIELIVGKENMERWYFNADLNSLIFNLSIYLGYDTTLLILKGIDIIYQYSQSFGNIKMVKKLYKLIVGALGEVAIHTIESDESNDYFEHGIKIARLKTLLLNVIKINKTIFNALSEEEVNQLFNQSIKL